MKKTVTNIMLLFKKIKFSKNLQNKEKFTRNLKKNLLLNDKKKSGRNNTGQITIRHRGGGVKYKHRIINYENNFQKAKILKIFFNKRKKSSYSLMYDLNLKFFFFKLTTSLEKKGDIIYTPFYKKKNLFDLKKSGNILFLKDIDELTYICNVETKPNSKSKIIRSSGTFGYIIKKDYLNKFAILKLPSGKEKVLSLYCKASLGNVSNPNIKFIKIQKAGINRNWNKRPTVRGVAMNPIDHPHGGRTSIGRPSVTPWGKPTK